MFKLVKTKPVENRHLNLSSCISDHDFPGREVYFLSLNGRPGAWLESGSGRAFLTSPHAYVLSRAAYEAIFDAIRTEDDFDELKTRLEVKTMAMYLLVKKYRTARRNT